MQVLNIQPDLLFWHHPFLSGANDFGEIRYNNLSEYLNDVEGAIKITFKARYIDVKVGHYLMFMFSLRK